MTTITYQPADDPYAGVIKQFVELEYPHLNLSGESAVQGVVKTFLGTKNSRLGPVPNIESQAKMYEAVRYFMDRNEPIPVLVPFASVKVPPVSKNPASVDLAEMSALKVLMRLQSEVKPFYAPGFRFVIRTEDLTEATINGHVDGLSILTQSYHWTLQKLILLLEMDSYTIVKQESKIVDREKWFEHVHEYQPKMRDYLAHSTGIEGSYPEGEKWLRETGFKGLITPAARSYYYDRYKRHYQNLTQDMYIEELSKYFTATLTRFVLQASGVKGKQLQLAFVPASPDAPRVSPRVIYRTVPRSFSEKHIMPWNARGLVKIDNSGQSRISLINWWEFESLDKTVGTLKIENEKCSVHMPTAYILE